MANIRASRVWRMNTLMRNRASNNHSETNGSSFVERIRILVLDGDSETLDRLENALWVWPHKVAMTNNLDEAVAMCEHLTPTALVADVKFADSLNNHSISTLRKRLPWVPIIALGSGSRELASRRMLDQGADAYLPRDELHRPTLYDLLQRIQREPNAALPLDHPVLPRMALPWQKSRIVGVLVCDIAGTIVDVNHCLARWLEYSTTDEIIGKYVWCDILNSKSEWFAWTKMAGDMSTLLHQTTTIKAKNGQLLSVKLEVFAAPSSPSYLQALFVDQTEIALLTSRTPDT